MPTATTHPLAGKPAPPAMLIDVDRLVREFLERTPDMSDARQRVSFGTSGHRGHAARRQPDRALTSRPSRRPSATTAAAAASTVRSTWARTRTRSPAPAQAVALEVLAGNGVETIIQRDDGFTPTPVISRAILVWNRGRQRPARRRHRHHAFTQSAGGWRLQVQPAARRSRRHRRDPLDSGPRERAARSETTQSVRRVTADAARTASTTRQDDLVRPVRGRSGRGHRHRVDPRRERDDWRGPARWRIAAVLAGHRRALPPEHHHRQLDDRSGVRLHDARSRRQDPDGLLQPVRDGVARRAAGPVSGRRRERSRCRPARHRHAVGRADEPESLSGGRDRLSRRQPAAVVRRTRPSARPWSAAA